MARNGPPKVDRPSRFTLEERREKHLARARKYAPEHNARRREKKQARLLKRSLSEE